LKKRIKVLASSCGGGIGPDVIYGLKQNDLNLYVIGMDGSNAGRSFGSQICDEVVEAPFANDPRFKERIDDICEKHEIDVIIFNHSKELRAIADRKLLFNTKCLLPKHEDMLTCTSKWRVIKKLLSKKLEDAMPKTSLVDNKQTIIEAFKEFKAPLWLRIPEGSGARGALLVNKPKHAVDWIDYWKEMKNYTGQWLLQEYLPGRNFSWSSVWHEGQLIASSSQERIEYFMANAAVTGISGATSVARIAHDERLHKLGVKVVSSIFYPHGIFTIDAREDIEGNIKVTEIENRMQGRNRLYTSAGINLPEIIVKVLMDIPLNKSIKMIGGGVEGITLRRQLDFKPIVRVESGG